MKWYSLNTVCFILAMLSISCADDENGESAENDTDSLSDSAGDTSSQTSVDSSNCSKSALAEVLNEQLAAVESEVDFAFYLEDDQGHSFKYERGTATMDTPYESASTSKWVSATVILTLVDKGLLSLDDAPSDYLSETEWPVDATHPLYAITLRELLNFTSGLSDEAPCHNLPNRDYFKCVASIAEQNLTTGTTPGSAFYYASNHLQVAGAMAVRAGGYSDWASLFADFKTDTGLFSHSDYNLPSTTNPRLAGGMTWTGNDYVEFIRQFKNADFYSSDALVVQASSDQLGDTPIAYSPALLRTGEDWHYGFGMWIECHSAQWNCTNVTQVSSAGAFGAYPFWNKQYGFIGIIARQGELGTGFEGYDTYKEVRTAAENWAMCPAI